MDIVFEIEKQDKYRTDFAGMIDGVLVGHVQLSIWSEHAASLEETRLEDKERLTERDFIDAFCRFLKEQGYTELFIISRYEDTGGRLGFRLEDRDYSGWDYKYTFRREL